MASLQGGRDFWFPGKGKWEKLNQKDNWREEEGIPSSRTKNNKLWMKGTQERGQGG